MDFLWQVFQNTKPEDYEDKNDLGLSFKNCEMQPFL